MSKVAIASLASVICLASLELVVRVVLAQEPRPSGGLDRTGLTTPNDELGHTLSPHFDGPWVRGVRVTTNRDGLRDGEYGEKQGNEIRILSLGDSNAFGWGVALHNSYPKLVQRQLQGKLPACKISVINAAVHGYSTVHYLKVLEKLALLYHPDFVLWTFSSSNDVIENAVFTAGTGLGNSTQRAGFVGDSHLLRLAMRAMAPAIYFIGNRTEGNLDTTRSLMSKLVDKLRSRGLPHEAVVIPARHQVRPDVHFGAYMLELFGLDSLITRQSDAVIDYFRNSDISFTDTLPILKAGEAVAPVMFSDDNHPNENGHLIIARAVGEKIAPRIKLIAAGRCLPSAGNRPN